MGTLSLDKLDPGAQTVEVAQVIRHESYRETPEAVYNDIGNSTQLSMKPRVKSVFSIF